MPISDRTSQRPYDPDTPRIVVVGGGAAGLELVTRLGNRLGRRGKASITLVEGARTHLWKPLLHAVAAGSIDPGEYRNQLPRPGALARISLSTG